MNDALFPGEALPGNSDNDAQYPESVKRYEEQKRSDTTVVTLDLEKEELKVGESLLYRVEVRDRRGQSATTKDHVIRMAEDDNAADRQFAQQTERTETIQEKLSQVIAEQAKVLPRPEV